MASRSMPSTMPAARWSAGRHSAVWLRCRCSWRRAGCRTRQTLWRPLPGADPALEQALGNPQSPVAAVVLDADRYRWLVDQVASIAEADPQARVLKALQAKFDDHLASLGNDATLARVLGKPASRGKKIRLGKPL